VFDGVLTMETGSFVTSKQSLCKRTFFFLTVRISGVKDVRKMARNAWVGSIASYPGGPRFKCQLEDWLSVQDFFCGFPASLLGPDLKRDMAP
jgi:hypothetical protein